MIINEKGPIAENIYMLGHPGMPLFLIDSHRPTIVDTGLAFLADIYIEDIREVLGDRSPELCLITHAHFDHCGATARLKKRFPDMRVAASPHARAILSRPGAVERIIRLSHAATAMAGELGIRTPSPRPFSPFAVDRTLADGDCLQIADGLSIRVIEAPGHTRDMLCYYIPEQRVLFAAEAAGIPDQTGYISIDCLLDYDPYVSSLKKLAALDIDVIALGHRCAVTGADTRRYLNDALDHSAAFFETTTAFLQEEHGEIDRVMGRIRAFEYDPKPLPKQPEPAYMLNLEARVMAIARKCAAAAAG